MLMKKFIGKPYAGKSHVRIDEGAGKVDLPLPALLYREEGRMTQGRFQRLPTLLVRRSDSEGGDRQGVG